MAGIVEIKTPLANNFVSKAAGTSIDLVKDLTASNTKEQYRVAVGRGLLGAAATIYGGAVAIGMKGLVVSVLAAPTVPAVVAGLAVGAMLYAGTKVLEELDEGFSNKLDDMIESDRQVIDVLSRTASLTKDFDFFAKAPKTEPTFSLMPDRELTFDTEEPLLDFNPPMLIDIVELPKLEPPEMLREPKEPGFLDTFFGKWF